MYINRDIQEILKKTLDQHQIIVLYGARQVGKTTLLKNLFPFSPPHTMYLACDETRVQEQLIPDSLALKKVLGEKSLVVFDEMQSLPNPGLVLKIIADHLPGITAIATGSASFDLATKLSEPLTGRHERFYLYPFSFAEIAQAVGAIDISSALQDCLLYGSYPAVFNAVSAEEKIRTITQLADNYLYKDILAFDLIKNSRKIRELLVAIALQIGSEVSYHELGQRTGLNYKTIERHLDLLEKSFVLFRLHGFSRNLRNEINRKVKIYFYDCGVRNALVNNFNPLSLRSDGGALFENYMVSEVMKKQSLEAHPANLYFWRTHTGAEIDLIIERGGILSAIEIKLSKPHNISVPPTFINTYPESIFNVISLDNLESIRSIIG